MWFFLPYTRTELLSSRVQHVSWKPYLCLFQIKICDFPTLYQTLTAVLKSPACVLGTLLLFQIKVCDFPYPISELNYCPWGSSMCPGNLIPISDQNMWFSLPYTRTELLPSRVQHVSWEPYSYFRSKYVIFPPLYQNWTAVLKSPAGVLETFNIPISDQKMWFSLPYTRTELLSFRVQHVSWKPYSDNETKSYAWKVTLTFNHDLCDYLAPTAVIS